MHFNHRFLTYRFLFSYNKTTIFIVWHSSFLNNKRRVFLSLKALFHFLSRFNTKARELHGLLYRILSLTLNFNYFPLYDSIFEGYFQNIHAFRPFMGSDEK